MTSGGAQTVQETLADSLHGATLTFAPGDQGTVKGTRPKETYPHSGFRRRERAGGSPMIEKVLKWIVGKDMPVWRVRAHDAFAGEWYSVSRWYLSERAAQRAAKKRLRSLETVQPSSSSGGKGREAFKIGCSSFGWMGRCTGTLRIRKGPDAAPGP